MAPTPNPDSLPSDPAGSAADSPSSDDLAALIPDMELLESSASDALTAHNAMAAAAGSGRTSTPAPKLTDRATATTVRIASPKATIIDDPYADQMPELEPFAEAAPAVMPAAPVAPKALPATAQAPSLPAATPARPAPAPTRVAPPPSPTAVKTAVVAPAERAAPAPRAVKPAPRPAPPVMPAPAAAAANPKKMPSPETVAVPQVMDREFIARNRIVELYLSGGLPVRGATAFERFCRENPQMLDEIGLPERVHTGLRLLEASGKPEPWQEKPKQFWERPYVPAALSGLVLILGIAILMVNRQLTEQTRKVTALRQQVQDQPIDAATATSTVLLQPSRSGPAPGAAASIGGAAAQLVNLRIDETHSDFRAFRITIDRTGQGRFAVLNNLIKDSNGLLGFSLNTSAMGPGTYQLTIEGLDWRGDPQPDSWSAINVRH